MMKRLKVGLYLTLGVAVLSLTHAASPQAAPTATQAMKLSAFVGGSGVFTGLENGHNLSFTAGADLSILSFHGYHPALEIRGTYPVHSGTIVGEKNFLGGVRVDRQFGPLRPYVDFLAGRGELKYQNGGITIGPLTYLSTSTNVLSGGAGVDLDLNRSWSAKADYQLQRWSTPVTTTGRINPNVVTLAVVYHFDFNHSYKRNRHQAPAVERSSPPPVVEVPPPAVEAPPPPAVPQ